MIQILTLRFSLEAALWKKYLGWMMRNFLLD